MSKLTERVEEAKRADLNNKRYLSDIEASVYVGLSVTAFRDWAKRIGCRRKI